MQALHGCPLDDQWGEAGQDSLALVLAHQLGNQLSDTLSGDEKVLSKMTNGCCRRQSLRDRRTQSGSEPMGCLGEAQVQISPLDPADAHLEKIHPGNLKTTLLFPAAAQQTATVIFLS